ncbi:MAG: 2'-5' RNA ligase family protein [Balneolaceae bacterium]
MPKPLYFIALVPGSDIRKKIRELKEEMKERFDSKHALKSPAHITMQKPFRREEDREPELIQSLEDLASKQQPFRLDLEGFGAFPPRSIFVNVEDHESIQNLHQKLKQLLSEQFNFTEKEIQPKVYPHMTIATRDLNREAFQKAWPEFKEREFQDVFEVKRLFLLRHNGKDWDIYKEFPFAQK